MKLLHTSDLHLGKSLFDFSLLDDQRYMLDYLSALILKQNIDAVMIAGDIYDRPVPPAEAVRLYDFFLAQVVGDLGVPVIAIAGNHDSASRLEFGKSLYKASGYHVFGTPQATYEPVVLTDAFGEVYIHALPYFHPAQLRGIFPDQSIKNFDDAYKAALQSQMRRVNPAVRNIAVAHGYLAPVHIDSESMIISDSEINIGGLDSADSACFSAFDYTALGHLHAAQRAGGEYIRYSGSPLKYSLSEEKQEKSCTIIELGAKGDVQISQVPIPCLHDVRTVTGSFEQLMEPSYHKNRKFDDYVFAQISDSGILYPMEKLRTLFPNLLGLRFCAEDEAGFTQIQSSGETRKLSTLELFCRFYKDAKSEEIPAEKLRFIQEILAESEGEIA